MIFHLDQLFIREDFVPHLEVGHLNNQKKLTKYKILTNEKITKKTYTIEMKVSARNQQLILSNGHNGESGPDEFDVDTDVIRMN